MAAVILEVTASESGMKLLRFLERRLADSAPASALHRWIRGGQVRVNGGRSKAFSRLSAGDLVRLPPFALVRQLDHPNLPAGERANDFSGREVAGLSVPAREAAFSGRLGPDIRIVARTAHLLVLGKPAGLPCQPGSGHTDSLSARLAAAFAGAPYIPAPAHRIDRHTSGLVAVGLSHRAQQGLHRLFAEGQAYKEYLAWVWGNWTQPGPCLLADRLVRQSASGREGMAVLPGGSLQPLPENTEPDGEHSRPAASPNPGLIPGHALSSVLAVRTLCAEELPATLRRSSAYPFPSRTARRSGTGRALAPPPRATLLLLRPLSGRTHQLRVQLAARGFPIIGDGRYGSPPFTRMLLHAFALSLPGEGLAGTDALFAPGDGFRGERLEFSLYPSWPAPFVILPDMLALARKQLKPFTKYVQEVP